MNNYEQYAAESSYQFLRHYGDGAGGCWCSSDQARQADRHYQYNDHANHISWDEFWPGIDGLV